MATFPALLGLLLSVAVCLRQLAGLNQDVIQLLAASDLAGDPADDLETKLPQEAFLPWLPRRIHERRAAKSGPAYPRTPPFQGVCFYLGKPQLTSLRSWVVTSSRLRTLAATASVRFSHSSTSRDSSFNHPFSLRTTRQVASATRLLPSTKA